MKTLIVYYSRTGITRRVAERLAERLDDAVLQPLTEPADRSGILGFARAGKSAMRKETPPIHPRENRPADFDLVVLGTPVWAGTMASPVRTFLVEEKDALPAIACFCTTHVSGKERAPREMAELAGREAVATMALTERQVKRDDGVNEALDAFARAIRSAARA